MCSTHITIAISILNIGSMQTIGIVIRKWEKDTNVRYKNISKKNLSQQIHALHKKLKKEDAIYTEFSIEKDKHSNKYCKCPIFQKVKIVEICVCKI